MRAVIALALALPLAGCSDLAFRRTPPPPPAEPPTPGDDGSGAPPDWSDCGSAWLGQYYNLAPDDEGVDDPEASLDPLALPFWDAERLVFQQVDTTLDFGTGWWPVDEGWQDDPELFAVRWTAWIRALSNTQVQLALGAATDAWVRIGGEQVAAITGAEEFAPALFPVDLEGGQYRIEVRYLHRLGEESGMRFRVAEGNVRVCAPEFE